VWTCQADACLSGEDGDDLKAIFAKNFASKNTLNGSPRVRIFSGASLLRAQVETAAEQDFLKVPTTVDDQTAGASSSIWDAGQRVPSSIQHRYVVCSEKSRALGLLGKLVRSEIARWQGMGRQPRMIVYAADAATAQAMAAPLQSALFSVLGGDSNAGLLGLSVLLPSAEDFAKRADNNTLLTYESSLRVMEMFYWDQVSLLVTTPRATRGLDFPNVTHVFNLGILGTAADYLHRAGRCGRIGQDITDPGLCISVLAEDQFPLLMDLGSQLGFAAEAIELQPEAEVTDESSAEDKIRLLEDTFQLFSDPGATPTDN
jgi:superfamily II DNA/RNA helicase